MHWPDCMVPGRSNREMRAETWRALEELYDEGAEQKVFFSLNSPIFHRQKMYSIMYQFICICAFDRDVPGNRSEQLPHSPFGGVEGGLQHSAPRQPGECDWAVYLIPTALPGCSACVCSVDTGWLRLSRTGHFYTKGFCMSMNY